MIELMAVLIIMGLLFAVVAQNFMGRTEGAKVTTTEASLKVLHTSVNMFKMDTGRYPTEDEGLLALVEQPLDLENYPLEGYLDLTEVPLDGWNREFIYQEYPESGKPFVIIRNAKKDYGTANAIEGLVPDKGTALLVEDIATTGGQVIQAARDLTARGITVEKIVAVLDRLEGARQNVESAGFDYESLLTVEDLGIRKE